MKWDPEDYKYEPSELWLGLVAAGSLLAEFPADLRLLEIQRFSLVITPAKFFIIPFEGCTYGTAVWTFWELGTQIAQRYPGPDPVPTFFSRIQTDAGNVGLISIKKLAKVIATSKSSDNGTVTAAARRRDTIMRPSLRADSGSKPVHEDPNLVVRYNFRGQPLVPGQVFTAFLRANTFYSVHGRDERGVTMMAYSSDRSTCVALCEVPEGPGRDQLTWERARTAMRTVWREIVIGFVTETRQFVDGPRWESLTFQLEYNGVKIAQGLIG